MGESQNTFFKVHKLLRSSLCRTIDDAKRPSVLLSGTLIFAHHPPASGSFYDFCTLFSPFGSFPFWCGKCCICEYDEVGT